MQMMSRYEHQGCLQSTHLNHTLCAAIISYFDLNALWYQVSIIDKKTCVWVWVQQQKVCWLDISIENSLLVALQQDSQDIVGDLRSLSLRAATLLLCASNSFQKGSSLGRSISIQARGRHTERNDSQLCRSDKLEPNPGPLCFVVCNC